MIEILYQDNDILVCVKPSGTLSERSEDKLSLPSEIERQEGIGELFTVHRLDREVSGVMVYAKNPSAAAKLSSAIAERRFHKEYLAVLEGEIDGDGGVLKDLLFRDSRKNKSYVVERQRRGVKDASLEYTVVERGEGTTRVRIILHTGRTHQIRAQFASRGHSVVGDRRYGSKTKREGIELYSHKIEFEHPRTNEKLSFEYTPRGTKHG